MESSDDRLKRMDWFILVLMNPDGYVYSQKSVRTHSIHAYLCTYLCDLHYRVEDTSFHQEYM
jgi:hypothetical protein